MSVNYSTATLNARLNAVVNQIGGGGAAGSLQIIASSAPAVLSTITFASTTCGTVAAGVLTFTTPLADNNIAASGTMGSGRIVDSTSALVVSGLTVGNSSAFDIVASQLSIIAGNVLSLLSATITGN